MSRYNSDSIKSKGTPTAEMPVGIVRLMLAMWVVVMHVSQFTQLSEVRVLGGVEAVQTFFMISGFYMALILNEKYVGPGSYRLFITNRFLRIYPIYYAVFVSVVAFFVVVGGDLKDGNPLVTRASLPAATQTILWTTDLTVIGQDQILFLKTSKGEDAGTGSFRQVAITAAMTNPPAWSLSIELMFYLVAPFLVRRTVKAQLLVIALATLLRLYLFVGLDLKTGNWLYRFFPVEVGTFLAGSVAYHVYLWLRRHRPPQLALAILWAAYVGFLIGYPYVPAVLGRTAQTWIFNGISWVAIPYLFLASKGSKVDRYVGEMSYPVYIAHYPLIGAMIWATAGRPLPPAGFLLAVVCATLVAALLCHHLVSEPVERLRARFRARAETRPAAELKA